MENVKYHGNTNDIDNENKSSEDNNDIDNGETAMVQTATQKKI